MRTQGEWDAIVVGAGPAGSASAALLARDGFSTLLLDRAAFPRDKACGEYTSPETEAVLRRIGALDALERAGTRRWNSMRVISPSGHSFKIEYDSSNTNQPTKQVLATRRRVLDATLVDYARACGAIVRERTRVDRVTQSGGVVTGVAIRSRGGGAMEERARLVIGADGVHSAVVRSLGLRADLRWPLNFGMVAHYGGYSGLDDWGEMHVSSNGYAGLAPQSDGVLNVGLVMPMKLVTGRGYSGSVARFEAFAKSFPGVAQVLHGAHRLTGVRGVGPIGARVRRTWGPGYLLVGDAAGFFDPFTGEGVYKALRGAEIASQVARQALEKGNVGDDGLAEYGKLRRREFTAKEIFCRMVQGFVAVPPLMDYIVKRVDKRQNVRAVLTGVLGDYADARAALSPAYLVALMRP